MTPEEKEAFERASREMRVISTARWIFIGFAGTYDLDRITKAAVQSDIERAIDMAERFELHAEAWMESE